MENLPTDDTGEVVDKQGKEISQHCLALPMILRKILERFSNYQLVKFSLVNKQWNYEARCLMKKRGNISARIFNVEGKGDERGRRKLGELASALGKMRVIPFSGIQFIITDRHDCEPSSNASLDPSYQEILDRLPWKHFSVRFCTYSKRCKDCPGILFVKKVLEDRSQVLEDLSFLFDSGKAVGPFEQVFQPRTFPRLKTLKLKANKTELLTKFAKLLVSCAPNLMELHVEGDLNFNEDVLEGSSAVLVPASAFGGSNLNPLYGQVCDSLVGKLRPKSIQIQAREYEHFDEELLERNVPMRLLQAARTTLTSVTMDLLYILPVMCTGICLENVTELIISVHGYMFEQFPRPLLTLLAHCDFTRCFPKLHLVNVVYGIGRPLELDDIVEFVEQALELDWPLPDDRAINIEQLMLGGPVSDSTVPFWAQMFPHVNKLTVIMERHSCGHVFTLLWDHFKCLSELEFRFLSPQLTSSNLDSAFCGIFPEEVAELREKDEEYLKAVNIVPVMPSIRCMRDLRTLILQFTPDADEEEGYMPTRGDPSLLLTKVTGLIGFVRCPRLAVTIRTDSCPLAEALGPLKPYASFTSVDDGSQKEEESLSKAFTIYL